VEWVKQLFPHCRHYTDVYAQHNLLGKRTLLGHCIHLSDNELEVFQQTKTKAIHCPDSNFFLHSGRFPLEKMEAYQIPFALATDVGAGSSHAMRFVMKMFQYRQNRAVSLEKTFYAATLGGARVLGKEAEIGSIECGKQADLAFFPMPQNLTTVPDLLANLTYLLPETPAKAVFIAGTSMI